MENSINKRELKKDLLLIVVGALLASIPTLLSTYMLEKSQLNQIILNHKISALKDYAQTYNNIVSDLLPKIEILENRIIYLTDNYTERNKFDKKMLEKIRDEFYEYLDRQQSWFAEVNANTLIINSLFEINLSLYEIYYFDPLKIDLENKTIKESLFELKKDIIELKKHIVRMINNEQNVMNKISYLIK